jgi:hypothetical protein
MRNLFSLAFPAWGATPLAHPLAALGLLLATAGAAQAQTTTNFTYTAPGSPQTYTVPAGITKLNVVATGGGGGGNRGNNRGGLGAVVQATVTVVPGEVLTVVVGGRGADSNNNGSSSVGGAGGYNGGGNGSYTGGGGGGATDLRRAVANGSTGDYFTSRNALLVAGGGGAADSGPAGGAGGTPNGGNGVSGQGGPAGQGATTTALGGGYLGSNGTGGNANPNNFNAAGGGGYYGGGGAGGPAGTFATGLNGGGGGSSYVLPTGSSNVSYSLAGALANGALAITTVPTPTNNALALDGSDDYVALPNTTPVPTGNSAYTLEAWIKPTSMGVYGIIGWGNWGTPNQVNALRLSPTGIVNYWWGPDLTVNTPNLSGQWHHVAATFNGTTRTIYLDGVAVGSDTPGSHTVPSPSNLRIGSTNAPSSGANYEYFSGSIDEVRIYNVGLTQAQVQADMFSTTAAVPASLKAYYNFDQGTAGGSNAGLTSLTDQSGNNSTGTLTNFALTGTSSNWVRSFPTITGIAPATGNIGSSVTVTGTNLTDATGFAFNGTAVSPFTAPTGDLTATVAVPSGATTGPVSVSSATLATYNGPTFTVTYPNLVVNTTATIPAGIYNSITVNSPGVATLAGNVTVNTSLTVNSGATLNDGCFVLSGAGDFTLAAGGTLGICNAQGLGNTTGTLQNAGFRSLSIDATYVYNGTGAQVTGGQLPYQVRNLTSTNSNTVTLSQSLNVAQVLTLNAGDLNLNGRALTLLSSASGTALVANLGMGQVQGTTTTVQRYIDPTLNPGLGYRHLTSPVFNATVAAFGSGGTTPVVNNAYNSATAPGTVTPFPTIFSYDQNRLVTSPATTLSAFDKGWMSPTSLGDAATPALTGFTVQLPGASTLSFLGQIVGGTSAVSLSRASGATAADAGLNLIGNPYPSPLDLSTITTGQRTNVDAAFYVFESTSQYGGSYRSYVNGVASTGSSSLVGTAQAFFVRVTAGQTNGSLEFTNANRITTYGQQAAVRRTAETRPLMRLALQGASGPADTFTAYAQDGATAGFDGEYDAAKLPNSTGLNLSSATASDNLAIDGRAAFTAATVLALSVGVPAAGTYSLSAASLANLPAGLTPTLRDAATGQLTPLTAGTSYRFSVTAAEATALLTNRFTLQFSAATALAAAASLSASEVSVYPNPAHGRFTVLVPAVAGAGRVQAELLNTLGQVVRRQSAALPAAGATLPVETAGLAPGVYTLRLSAGASTLAKRVVLQ